MNNNKRKNTWLWILLCLPMVFIVYFAITLSGNNIDADKVSAVSISTPNGKSYEISGDDIAFYVDMYLEADPLSAPVRDVEGEAPMNVTIKQKGGDTSFGVYAEVNTNGCFFRNNQGNYFAIPADFAKKLLQREECAYVYGNAGHTLPALSFVTGEKTLSVLPKEYSWQYKNIAGVAVNDTVTQTATSTPFYSFYSDAGFSLKFAKEPSRCTVTFYKEDGTALDAADPSALIFPTDTKLSAVVDASWGEDSTAVGGNAKYSFDLLYDVLPEIIRSTESVYVGDVLCIGFRHLSENEKITLETQLATADIAVNYGDGSAYALLPIGAENTAGQYSLKFTVGNVEKTIELSVKDSTGEFHMDTMDTEKYTKYCAPDFKQSYAALMQEWAQTTNQPLISAGNAFSKPTDGKLLYDYGSDLLINNLPDKYLLEGIQYRTEVGAGIKSTQRGVVVYVGTDEVLGNMIVIDHGYGLKSHYYGVGTVGKSVGDTVQEGEIIGTGGVSGLTYMAAGEKVPTLHFYISLNGVFINPNPLFSDGLYILN